MPHPPRSKIGQAAAGSPPSCIIQLLHGCTRGTGAPGTTRRLLPPTRLSPDHNETARPERIGALQLPHHQQRPSLPTFILCACSYLHSLCPTPPRPLLLVYLAPDPSCLQLLPAACRFRLAAARGLVRVVVDGAVQHALLGQVVARLRTAACNTACRVVSCRTRRGRVQGKTSAQRPAALTEVGALPAGLFSRCTWDIPTLCIRMRPR